MFVSLRMISKEFLMICSDLVDPFHHLAIYIQCILLFSVEYRSPIVEKNFLNSSVFQLSEDLFRELSSRSIFVRLINN